MITVTWVTLSHMTHTTVTNTLVIIMTMQLLLRPSSSMLNLFSHLVSITVTIISNIYDLATDFLSRESSVFIVVLSQTQITPVLEIDSD